MDDRELWDLVLRHDAHGSADRLVHLLGRPAELRVEAKRMPQELLEIIEHELRGAIAERQRSVLNELDAALRVVTAEIVAREHERA